jgi:hypothetical protein
MAAQMVGIQPLKRALGGNIYLELTEWNGSKKVDLRFWKNGTVPTKEGVSLHLDQWKILISAVGGISTISIIRGVLGCCSVI